MCRKAELETFFEEEKIFDSDMKSIALVMLTGSANVYKSEDEMGKKLVK